MNEVVTSIIIFIGLITIGKFLMALGDIGFKNKQDEKAKKRNEISSDFVCGRITEEEFKVRNAKLE